MENCTERFLRNNVPVLLLADYEFGILAMKVTKSNQLFCAICENILKFMSVYKKALDSEKYPERKNILKASKHN